MTETNFLQLSDFELCQIDGGKSWIQVGFGILAIAGGACVIGGSGGNPFVIAGGVMIIFCGVAMIGNA